MLEQQLMNRDAGFDAIIIETESGGPQYLADFQVLYQITKKTLEENNIDINTLSIESSNSYIQSLPEEARLAINIFISLRYLRRFEERMSLRGDDFLEEFYHIAQISINAGFEATYLGSEWKSYVESKQKQKDNQKNGGEGRASKYEKSEEVTKEIFMRLWKASKKPKSHSQWAYIVNKKMPKSQSIPKLAKGTLRQKIPIWLTECKK